jgi:hypothetical protein
LSGEWFDKIEAMDTKTDDQIDAWIAQIEAKDMEGKP